MRQYLIVVLIHISLMIRSFSWLLVSYLILQRNFQILKIKNIMANKIAIFFFYFSSGVWDKTKGLTYKACVLLLNYISGLKNSTFIIIYLGAHQCDLGTIPGTMLRSDSLVVLKDPCGARIQIRVGSMQGKHLTFWTLSLFNDIIEVPVILLGEGDLL